MHRLTRVPRSVPVRRGIAAADLPAAHAHAQVHPAATDLQALLTPIDRRRQRRDRDLVEMAADGFAHLCELDPSEAVDESEGGVGDVAPASIDCECVAAPLEL